MMLVSAAGSSFWLCPHYALGERHLHPRALSASVLMYSMGVLDKWLCLGFISGSRYRTGIDLTRMIFSGLGGISLEMGVPGL